MKYYNIRKDCSIELSEDKLFTKKELFDRFASFIQNSGYSVYEWVRSNKAPYELIIYDQDNKPLYLSLYLKNITGAGWQDKPKIKRVQVTNVRVTAPDNYVNTTDNQSLMVLGYYEYDDNPIMVAWDAYRYVNHKTMRSCYVNIDTLIRAYQLGYLTTTNASQKVWIFTPQYFGKFVDDYIEYKK